MLTLLTTVILLIASSDAIKECNERILSELPLSSIRGQHNIKNISVGNASSIPLFYSNKVFILRISTYSKDKVEFKLDREYYITGIGIRQRFNTTELGNGIMCPSSHKYDYTALYNITYSNSKTSDALLDYPPGTGRGQIRPNRFLSNEEYDERKFLEVAINPTKMNSIIIRKEAIMNEATLLNPGTFCVQYELYGCSATTELHSHHRDGVLEYQIETPFHADWKYTGLCAEGICTGGMGTLTDGIVDIDLNNPRSYVKWRLNETTYGGDITVSNTNLSGLKILVILDSYYIINKITISGFGMKNEEEFAIPNYMSVNGILFSTLYITATIGDIYNIFYEPLTVTNSLLLELFVDTTDVQIISLAEIQISTSTVPVPVPASTVIATSTSTVTLSTSTATNTTTSPTHPYRHVCECMQYKVAFSLVGSLIALLLSLSIIFNMYFVIRLRRKLNAFTRLIFPPKYDHVDTNQYMPNTANSEANYESIDMSQRSLPLRPEHDSEYDSDPDSDPIPDPIPDYIPEFKPTEATQEPEPEDVEESEPMLFRSIGSVTEMSSNPTYVTSLPPIDETPGYSHLEFSESFTESVSEMEVRPEIDRRYSVDSMSAKQRRSSFSEQTGLSDLK